MLASSLWFSLVLASSIICCIIFCMSSALGAAEAGAATALLVAGATAAVGTSSFFSWANVGRAISPETSSVMKGLKIFMARFFSDETERSSLLAPGKKITKREIYQPRTLANISGATIVASDSITKRGVVERSLPHVIFSLGTAPE